MNKLINLKFPIRFFYLFILGLCVYYPKESFAQLNGNAFESGIRLKLDSLRAEKEVGIFGNGLLLPNGSVASVMTPSGFGGGNTTYIYVVVGGVFPAEYKTPATADLITAAGLSFGDPKKYVNFSGSVNIGRVSELKDFSANVILSRQIFKSSSIAVGALQLFASSAISDAPDATFYVAFSHSVQTIRSKSGHSALGYTIGFGNGRFLYKSPLDIASGKGKYGTGVFANISYELFSNMNINAEWSGLNLGFSSGFRPFAKSPLTFGYGVYNLTRNSSDRISFIGTLAYPFILDRKTNKQN